MYSFNRVIQFDSTSGFNGAILNVFNYYKPIPSGLIAARVVYLGENYKIPNRVGSRNSSSSFDIVDEC